MGMVTPDDRTVDIDLTDIANAAVEAMAEVAANAAAVAATAASEIAAMFNPQPRNRAERRAVKAANRQHGAPRRAKTKRPS